MPIYEYDCPACGRVEVMQKASDPELSKCPYCAENGKKSKVKRVLSQSSFHLKGSGWYKTDYAGGSSSSSSSTTSTSSATSTETAKAETKTETKKETKSSKPPCGGGCSCH